MGRVTSPKRNELLRPGIRFKITKRKTYELSIRDSSSEVVTVTTSVAHRTLSATNGNFAGRCRNYFWKVTAKDDAGNESVSPEFHSISKIYFLHTSLLYPLANDTVRNNDVDPLFTKTFDINAQTDASDAVLIK